ncbi:MAG: hypothetical protein EHM39_00840, partial [Chloroflexi bacterium]
ADGSIWFGTSAGAAQLAGGRWYTYTAQLPSASLRTIMIDLDRARWFGTDAGVAWFDGATWETYTNENSGLPGSRVNTIAQDMDRSIWFGGEGGAACFDGLAWTTFTTANSGLPGADVRAIAVDSDGVKWMGTNAGLARFDGATWTVYTDTLSLPSNDVRAIIVDSNNVKWVATAGGLARFDGERWTQYTAGATGLPDNDIRALAVDLKGIKWLGLTAAGVGVLYDSPNYAIVDNPAWIDPRSFTATYDFSAMIPKGVYSLTIGEAPGTDGILSASNQAYTFTLDYASFVADTTPPPQPAILAYGDGGLNAISMQWSANDADSGITDYRYAIGSTPGGEEVVNWTKVTGTTITRTGLSLIEGQSYYVTVQARNAGGLWSPSAVSPAVVAGVASGPKRIALPLLMRVR